MIPFSCSDNLPSEAEDLAEVALLYCSVLQKVNPDQLNSASCTYCQQGQRASRCPRDRGIHLGANIQHHTGWTRTYLHCVCLRPPSSIPFLGAPLPHTSGGSTSVYTLQSSPTVSLLNWNVKVSTETDCVSTFLDVRRYFLSTMGSSSGTTLVVFLSCTKVGKKPKSIIVASLSVRTHLSTLRTILVGRLSFLETIITHKYTAWRVHYMVVKGKLAPDGWNSRSVRLQDQYQPPLVQDLSQPMRL